jgi:hypothetical protein
MTNEHPAITLLRQYDEAKVQLRAIEVELNKECALYGRDILGLWGFAPSHLRQRLHALGLIKNNHATGSVSETKEQDQ